MSTYYYPAAFATEAARNLRELASVGELDTAGVGTHPVIADLREAARAMRQVLDQLATAHTIPGHPPALRAAALETADELHQAGTALDETDDRAVDQRATSEHLLLAPGQQVASFGAYTIIADPDRGYIAMYRQIDDVPSPEVPDAQDRYVITTPAPTAATAAAESATSEAATRRSERTRREARHVRPPEPDGSWFAPPATGGAARGRGLGL